MSDLPIYICRKVLFKNNDLVVIADICVSITVSMLLMLYVHWGGGKSKHYKLDHPE